jgi:cell division septal protein FtsQ
MPPRSQARRIGNARLRSVELKVESHEATRRSKSGVAEGHLIGGVLRRIVYLGVALAVGYGLIRLLSDRFFEIDAVEIRGTRYLGQPEVLSTAEIVGVGIFQVSTAAAMGRLMRLGVPEDATISLRLPNKVTIVINERPAAYLWKSGASTFAVSDDGTVLGVATTDHPSVLVIDSDARKVERGEKVDVRVLRAADYIVRTIPAAAGFVPRSVDVTASLGAAVVSPDGITIVIGDDRDLAGKLGAAGPTLFAARQAQPPAAMIDLRFVGHPIYR